MSVTAPGRPRPVTPVGIVADRLAEALALLDEPATGLLGAAGPHPRVRELVARAHAIASGLDPYLEAQCGEESVALRALAAETARHDWAAHAGADGPAPLEQEMVSGHVEGRLLAFLVRLTRACRVLEIGMFTGYSALAIAEALPPDGRVVACEIDPEAAGIARRRFAASPCGERVDVRLGPALDTLHDLSDAGQRFDLVFIDADKGGYLDYLHALLDRDLLTRHALICVDNTLMQGQPWTSGPDAVDAPPAGRAIAAFNRAVAADPRLEQVLLPLRDGVTLIRRVED